MSQGIITKIRTFCTHLSSISLLSRRELSRLQKLWLFSSETVRAVSRHQTFTLAAALAFKTLLSVVPLLLIGMAVSMTMGTENGVSYADGFLNAIEAKIPQVPALQPLLDLLRNLAKRPREIAGIGFLMLFLTAYSLLASIDWCINYIFQVKKRRPLVNRLVSYFLIVIIVPVLMSLSVVANSQIASFVDLVANHIESVRVSLISGGNDAAKVASAGLSGLTTIALNTLSSLITCIALVILIKLMPNTRVKLKAAIYGGLTGGLLIELTRYFFSLYTAHAAENLTRLYGSTMLFIPITLLWLWISWAFVLLGAEVAFAAQNYHTLALRAKISEEGLQQRIYIGLRLLINIARDFVAGAEPRPLLDQTAQETALPAFVVGAVAEDLVKAGILRESASGEDCYLPGKDLGVLTALEVAEALERDRLSPLPYPQDAVADRLSAAFSQIDSARRENLGNLTLRDLAL